MTRRPSELDITIVTGLSGAGRSEAANVLEDLGFFVIDNLPPAADPQGGRAGPGAGPAADPLRPRRRRPLRALVEDSHAALERAAGGGARTRIAVPRGGRRRARPPLRGQPAQAPARRRGSGCREAIAEERALLEPLKAEADVVVDTSNLNVHELRDRLRDLFAGEPAPTSASRPASCRSASSTACPLDVDLVFDCRFLPNPHWVESLRPLPGTTPEVRATS